MRKYPSRENPFFPIINNKKKLQGCKTSRPKKHTPISSSLQFLHAKFLRKCGPDLLLRHLTESSLKIAKTWADLYPRD